MYIIIQLPATIVVVSCKSISPPQPAKKNHNLGFQTAVCTGYLWWWNLPSTGKLQSQSKLFLEILVYLYVHVFVIVCVHHSADALHINHVFLNVSSLTTG